jgi:hypothetical protein
MKHNLNARAIAGLSEEVVSVQANVDRLVREMESAITQADAFIASCGPNEKARPSCNGASRVSTRTRTALGGRARDAGTQRAP